MDLVAQHGDTGLGALTIDTIQGAASLLFEQNWSRLSVQLGGGLHLGVVRLEARPVPDYGLLGNTLAGASPGAIVTTSATLRLTRRIAVDGHLEGGYILAPMLGSVSW